MLADHKVALVTGCSRGIGCAVMKRLVEEGAIVYANARAKGSLDSAIAVFPPDMADRAKPVYFDVTDRGGIKKCIMQIKKEQGKLDILVNNAGVMKDAYLEMLDPSVAEEVFATNVMGVINVTQTALRLMRPQGYGSIVNVSSIVGERGNVGQTAYAASKGAVSNLTKTWARELVQYGIRVNAVAPGNTDTELFHSIGREQEERIVSEIGLGRLGRPEEIADAVLFLASDMASYITGEILGVNGGWFL